MATIITNRKIIIDGVSRIKRHDKKI